MGFTLSQDPLSLKTAETMVFVSLVIYQLVHSLSISQDGFIFAKGFFRNYRLFLAILFSLIMLLIALYVPLMSSFIHTVPLQAKHWLVIVLSALVILIVDEIRKLIFKSVNQKKISVNQKKIHL